MIDSVAVSTKSADWKRHERRPPVMEIRSGEERTMYGTKPDIATSEIQGCAPRRLTTDVKQLRDES
ncbi:hypothetical protein DFQ28_006093, partial [Apophysomyces sp. BC1034]